MVKKIGNIKIYSVKDLHKALGVNERTLRDWFNKRKLKGRKIGTEWHITEENLKEFLSGDSEANGKVAKKKTKKRKGRGRP